MKAALRMVRFYNGGVSLHDLLASARLMRLADQGMASAAAVEAHTQREASLDADFYAHAAEWVG